MHKFKRQNAWLGLGDSKGDLSGAGGGGREMLDEAAGVLRVNVVSSKEQMECLA